MARRRKRAGRITGTTVRPGGRVGAQIVASAGPRWSEAHEQRFLDELSTHCNVTRAAAAVGFSTVAIYRRRRGDAGFHGRWCEALKLGHLNVETLLLHRATEALTGGLPDPTLMIDPMTVKEALSLWRIHLASVAGGGKPRHGRVRPRTFEEMQSSILARLTAIEQLRAAGADPAVPDDTPGEIAP